MQPIPQGGPIAVESDGGQIRAQSGGQLTPRGPLALRGVEFLQGKDAPVPVAALAGKTVMIYCGAQWCSPCNDFTPKLDAFYREFSEAKNFEIIFASWDRTQAEFDEHFAQHPWLALPFDDSASAAIGQLTADYRVAKIPTLLVFSPDGGLITREGVRCLEQDPKATAFPWASFAEPPRWLVTIVLVSVIVFCAVEKRHPSLSNEPLQTSNAPLPLRRPKSSAFYRCYDSFVGGYVPTQYPKSMDLCSRSVVAISYDANMVNPSWSAYHITPHSIAFVAPGTPRPPFYLDPDLQAAGIAQAGVYSGVFKREGWDRGHLAPSRILSGTQSSQLATFTMANVAPQAKAFNNGPWNNLEERVFEWISTKQRSLYIVTGVAYRNRNAPRRSLNDNIAIPDYFWKVLCDPTARQSVGFIGKNEPSGTVAYNNVQYIEHVFGGDVFPADVCRTDRVTSSYWLFLSTASVALGKYETGLEQNPPQLAAAWRG